MLIRAVGEPAGFMMIKVYIKECSLRWSGNCLMNNILEVQEVIDCPVLYDKRWMILLIVQQRFQGIARRSYDVMFARFEVVSIYPRPIKNVHVEWRISFQCCDP